MKLCFLTHIGLEQFCKSEAKRKLNLNCELKNSVVISEATTWQTIFKATYFMQSPIRIGLYLDDFEFSSLDDIEKKLHIDVSEYITQSIHTECIRKGNHLFGSEDVKKIGNGILSKKYSIDYDHPTSILTIYIVDNHCYITLDLVGADCGKRLYKLFQSSDSLKGTLAYSFLEYAKYDTTKRIIDPMCGSGIIPIEAALSSLQVSQWFFNNNLICKYLPQYEEIKLERNISPLPIFGYDHQMRCVKISQKNSKLAGIDKAINISRADLEWLDTKQEENSTDLIITQPPEQSKVRSERDVEKLYGELFHQAEWILKKDGILVTMHTKPELYLELSKRLFELVDTYKFPYGTGEITFITLRKQ